MRKTECGVGKKCGGKNSYAAYFLYAVSLVGFLDLFSSGSITGHYTPLIGVDIAVYIVMILLAIRIHQGHCFAKWAYGILAVVWYCALLFYLPKFHHTLDWYTLFMQWVLSILALWALLRPKKSQDL
ncbi:MAG: hypothetical protein NTV32_02555 [Gammaproteobacteria bacterium]|jgi:hypothetical protein|nr:hypothetical protein [Gammaproteobacteria bacterium]